MSNIELTKGARYRVLSNRAKLTRMVPCSFVLFSETRPLKLGEVITYKHSPLQSWGSDPGVDAVFVTDDNWEGALYPAGIWGGVSDTVLAPAEETQSGDLSDPLPNSVPAGL